MLGKRIREKTSYFIFYTCFWELMDNIHYSFSENKWYLKGKLLIQNVNTIVAYFYCMVQWSMKRHIASFSVGSLSVVCDFYSSLTITEYLTGILWLGLGSCAVHLNLVFSFQTMLNLQWSHAWMHGIMHSSHQHEKLFSSSNRLDLVLHWTHQLGLKFLSLLPLPKKTGKNVSMAVLPHQLSWAFQALKHDNVLTVFM